MVNNGGGGLPNLQDNTSQVRRPWISLTPENFMETRSYQVPADTFQNLVGSTSYGHLRGMPNSYMQTQNVSLRDPASRHGEYSWYDGGLGERNRMINHIAGSYTQGLYNNSTSWNNLPFEKCLESSADFVTNRSMGLNMNVAQGGPLIPDLHSYVGSNIGGVYDSLVPHHSHHWNLSSHTKNTDMMPDIRAQVNSNGNDSFMSSLLLRSKNYCSDSTPLDVSNYFNQMPQYDLNSVPRTETNSTSTIANLTHIAPMTPDPAKVLGSHHFPPIPNFRIDEGLSLEKDKQTDFITMVQDESTRQQCSELLQNIGNSSSAAVSTPFREMKSSDKERGKGIDLNKTPWQKQPKRRKHRPKVVIEGKTKRTPSKPTATEDNKENPSGKRKYVRRKGLKGSAIPPEDVNQTIDCEDEPAAKTCRRALDFEEMHRDDIQKNDLMEEMQERHKRTYDLFSKSQATKLGMGMERNVSARSSALKDNSMIQNSQTATTDLTSIHRMLTNRLEVPSWGAAVEPSTTSNFQQLGNLDVGGRIPDKGNSVSLQGRYVSTQQHMHSAGIGRFANQGKSISDNEKPHLKAQSPGIVPEVLPNLNEPRGQKRDHSQTTTHRNSGTIDASGQSRSCQDILQVDEYHRHGISSSMGSEIRKKIENGLYENISIMCSGIAASSIGDNESAKRQNEGISGYTGDRWIQYMASQHNLEKQHFSLAQLPHAERVRGQNELAMVYTNSSLKIVESHHMHSQPPSIWSSAQGIEQAPRNFHGEVRNKKQPTGSTSSELVSSVTNKVQEDDVNSFQQSSQLGKGNLADVTTCQLGDSNLNERSNEVARQQEDAIVLYKGGGAVVPYDESELMKQRKLRPKVDLDSETEKVWNLLMGKESNEGLHGTDKEKEKWWEEERKIFRGRADSFIARMHLVQGDRRFSQWKGSVVDSVIGVFLTQNVSDHLSSSAFMCLAARFPLKSISNRRTCNEAETNILIEDPEDSTLSPQDSIKWSEQAFAEPSSVAPEISARCWSHTATTATEKCLVEAQNLSVEEEISSQDSFDSSMTRGTGEIRSCSGSNSEADLPTGSRKTDVSNLENSSMFREFFSCVNGSSVFDEGSEHGGLKDRGQGLLQSELDMIDTLKEQFSFSPNNMASLQMEVPAGLSNNCLMEKIPNFEVREVDSSRAFSDESMSSWPSIASGLTTENDLVYENLSFRELLGIMDKSPEKHIRLLRSDEAPTMGLNQSISKQSVRQQCNGVESGPCRGCDQPSPDTHQDEANKIFQFECTSIPKTSGVDETFGIGKPAPTEDNQIQIANEFVEPNSKFQDHSSQAYDEKNVSIPKAKKGMDEGQKKNTFDWDILRKNALADSSKKERSKDTRDSLDYEALRSANVREVAKAIEERGMNNMLAERIQDFLNRLVKDHGSMDLEWLRDVPPDKAKDYLLSIRGIGLKSVECVRLLTLHQLAFPVDTNVGRIAVRLGWVPLRPLPESMQIHLLEQYPVLESVQKYLWPRLCKLDQRTLYELHYQLITFGKVFCTKKNPNCNACPMRGECRHFASAFASARFALPGTEERGLVSSTNPITAEMQPAVVINLLPLPPPEESLPLGTPVNSKCEPIIEVPETPDQECTEASELQDMEDLFVDPDEIPTIKLDMEELLTTIQSLPNGDMSRALVALNPEAASLPTPKLKNVNKLRTEHQVYELPDSHPLLKGRDRREPDDPSPYLLAIWTPGETADSIQPPEKSCETQGSNRLCDRETCFSCSSRREANSQTVRGTLLIPCRTAMRGRFPLNGTYFQVNEVFADDVSSVKPIDVPREWIWNLRRRTVYFGTSVSSIFRGLTTEGIQYCFWRGFVCVRGFDQKSRAPRPLKPRLHYPASKLKTKKGKKDKET